MHTQDIWYFIINIYFSDTIMDILFKRIPLGLSTILIVTTDILGRDTSLVSEFIYYVTFPYILKFPCLSAICIFANE